jgi:hemoglobin
MERIEMATRHHVTDLVDLFYEKVRSDATLAPLFAHIDWQNHLPVMYNFWCSLLLGDLSYQGNPFAKHIPLGLNGNHFDCWLRLFHQAVDKHFVGPMAEEAKSRAAQIASFWRWKLEVN